MSETRKSYLRFILASSCSLPVFWSRRSLLKGPFLHLILCGFLTERIHAGNPATQW